MDHLYRDIVNSLSSGVVVADAAGTVRLANAAAVRHLNVELDTLAPGAPLAANPTTARLLALLEELRAGAPAIRRRELSLGGPRHAERVIGVTATPLPGDDSFNGAIFLFTDLSQLRQLERAAELNRQLAQVGELSAGVVHEIRNPVSVIGGSAEMLARRFDAGTSERRLADSIRGEARRLEKMVSHFLRFAKPFELHYEDAAASDIIARAVELCTRNAAARGVALEAVCDPALGQVRCDVNLLAQALGNLVGNAVEACAPKVGHVCVAGGIADGTACFSVADNGPGVQAHAGEDIFSPFFTQKEDGTGLGLAIVHRIASAHGGRASYENQERGACFYLSVPLRPAGAPE